MIETPIQAALRKKTIATVPHHQMMTTPEQAQFLAFLVKFVQARRVIEVGVFTGYASLSIAMALPEHGQLIACDIGSEWPAIGRPYWEQAGIAHKIDLRLAPAQETLQALLSAGVSEFDLIFIDADKVHYPEYVELGLQLIRARGLMVLDNVIWVGDRKVQDCETPGTRAISVAKARLTQDPALQVCELPIGSGMLLVSKKP